MNGATGIRGSLVASNYGVCKSVCCSILFRGIAIRRNTGIRCSLVVPNTIIGGNTAIHCTVITRSSMVRNNTIVNRDPRSYGGQRS